MTLKPWSLALAVLGLGGAPAFAATNVTTVPAGTAATTPSANILAHHGFVYQTRRKGGDTEGYFEIDNSGGSVDVLTAWKCPIADVTALVDAGNHPVPQIDVPAGGKVELSIDGTHLVLRNIHFQVAHGSVVPCSLTFQNAGEVGVMLYSTPNPKHPGSS